MSEHESSVLGSIGTASATFRVADLAVQYEARDPRIRFIVRDSIRPFVLPGMLDRPDCSLQCDVSRLEPTDSPVLFQAPTWELRRLPDGGEEILFRSTAPWARLRMSPDFSRGALTHSPDRDEPWSIFPGDYPVAEYVTCRLVGKRGGLHMHASAVTFGNRAFVFVGHSGAGKSTIAALAEGAGGVVLSDDRTILTVGADGATAWGTPWHGSLQRTSARAAPVAGLALLVQSGANRLSEIRSSAGLKEIFVRLIQPRLDADEVTNTMEAIQRLLASVPLYKFEFTPTHSAITMLQEAWGAA